MCPKARMLRPGTGCRFVAVLLTFHLTVSTAFSQSGLSDWTNVQTLRRDAPVVVKTVAGESYIGYVVHADADSLMMDTDERGSPGRPGRVQRRRQIRREEVRLVRMWARAASMLLSTGIGAGIGAGIGGAIEASSKSNEDRGLALAVLIVLGSALGFLMGRHSRIVKGRLVYAAPSSHSTPHGGAPPGNE